MTTEIDWILDRILETEGGYVNDPDDKGGETNYGITAEVARSYGFLGPMKELPEEVAKKIYEIRYVTAPGFSLIYAIDVDLGFELIDTGVNMGPGIAGSFLQRWLNAFCYEAPYQELFVDGRVGNVTAAALSRFLIWRGAEGKAVLMRALDSVQATRYLEITERDKLQRKFAYGWVKNRA